MRVGRDTLGSRPCGTCLEFVTTPLGFGILEEEWEKGSGKRVGGELGLILALGGPKHRMYAARVVLFERTQDSVCGV